MPTSHDFVFAILLLHMFFFEGFLRRLKVDQKPPFFMRYTNEFYCLATLVGFVVIIFLCFAASRHTNIFVAFVVLEASFAGVLIKVAAYKYVFADLVCDHEIFAALMVSTLVMAAGVALVVCVIRLCGLARSLLYKAEVSEKHSK